MSSAFYDDRPIPSTPINVKIWFEEEQVRRKSIPSKDIVAHEDRQYPAWPAFMDEKGLPGVWMWTDSGRLCSTGLTSIQQVPKGGMRRAIRHPTCRIMDADWRNCHWRIVADLSYDAILLNDLQNEDIYTLAGVAGGVDRPKAKAALNTLVNGGGVRAMTRDHGLTPGQAKAIIDWAEDRWPDAMRWKAKVIQECRQGIVDGAPCSSEMKAEPHRAISKYLISREAMALRALLETSFSPGIELIIPMHDGAVFLVDGDVDPEEAAKEIRFAMDQAFGRGAGVTKVTSGPSWGEQYALGDPLDVPDSEPLWDLGSVLATAQTAAPGAAKATDFERYCLSVMSAKSELTFLTFLNDTTLKDEVKKALRQAKKVGDVFSGLLEREQKIQDRVKKSVEAAEAGEKDEESRRRTELMIHIEALNRLAPGTKDIWFDAARDQVKLSPELRQVVGIRQRTKDNLRDLDLTYIKLFLDAQHTRKDGNEYHLPVLEQALRFVADINAENPLTTWLDRCADNWDKQTRLWDWLSLTLGIPLTEQVLVYGVKFLLSALARAYQPGCKVDTVFVLQGPQGAQKSSFFRALAGPEWFGDSEIEVGSKEAYLQVKQHWILEFAEMESLGRKEADVVKRFLSSAEDTYRPPYGRETIHVPRHSIFVGTTNKDSFLSDVTGDRRYWVVALTENAKIDVNWLELHRDQIWGEAVHLYRAGIPWWLTDAEDETREKLNTDFQKPDPLAEEAANWIKQQGQPVFTMKELFDGLDISLGDRTRMANQMGDALKRIGARKGKRVMAAGQRFYQWHAPEDLLPMKGGFTVTLGGKSSDAEDSAATNVTNP